MHLEEELELIETRLFDFRKSLKDEAMQLIKNKALAIGHDMKSENGHLTKHRWIETTDEFRDLQNFIFNLNDMGFEVEFQVEKGEFTT